MDARRSKVLLSTDTDPFSRLLASPAPRFFSPSSLPSRAYVRSSTSSYDSPNFLNRHKWNHTISSSFEISTRYCSYNSEIFNLFNDMDLPDLVEIMDLLSLLQLVGFRNGGERGYFLYAFVDRVRRWRDSGWRFPAFLLVDMLRATNLWIYREQNRAAKWLMILSVREPFCPYEPTAGNSLASPPFPPPRFTAFSPSPQVDSVWKIDLRLFETFQICT